MAVDSLNLPCYSPNFSAEHTQLVQSADPNLRLVASFLDYLKVEKGLAPLSVAAYSVRYGAVFGVSAQAEAGAARRRGGRT